MQAMRVDLECFLVMTAAIAACDAGPLPPDADRSEPGAVGGKADCIGDDCGDCSIGAPEIGPGYFDYQAPGPTNEGLASETPLGDFYDMAYGSYAATSAAGAYAQVHLTKEEVRGCDPFNATCARALRYWATRHGDDATLVEGFWWVRYVSGGESVALEFREWNSLGGGRDVTLTGLSYPFTFDISPDTDQYEWGFDAGPRWNRVGCADVNPPASCHLNDDVGGRNYCSEDCPCGDGEGDCDSDLECEVGLACLRGPGWDDDICVVDDGCVNAACSADCPCEEGEGDCNRNADCGAGLICVDEVGASYGYPDWYDVCLPGEAPCSEDPPGFADHCSDDCPCAQGQGDCDSDRECESGLRCVDDVGASYGWSSWVDVCL